MSNQKTKYIFVTGGVVSSLGKGILAASVGALLETRGLKVSLTKIDPYINLDPGTMSPFQHGEVFVSDDGAETDLDIGHYERFTNAILSKKNSFSTGQVYDTVLTKERRGDYLGMTVQVVPHITTQIKENIFKASEGVDVSIIEVGGTVGDIESLPFLETIRQIRYELGAENVVCIHLTLVPYIAAAKELKTKPTQHSVKELRQIGIQPDVLVCRSDRAIPKGLKEKIALFCNVSGKNVFEAEDVDSIYRLPLIFHKQGLDQVIINQLKIWTRSPDLRDWEEVSKRLDNPKHKCTIAVVGKYVGMYDAYKSIEEVLVHSGIANEAIVNIEYLDASKINDTTAEDILDHFDGVIVPGGFGGRGTEGKIKTIQYQREQKKPLFGICLGMQLMAIEFARNVLGYDDANSTEFDPETKHPIIHLMEEQKEVKIKGGTMRLGAYPCKLVEKSKAYIAYGQKEISERHRHRYEFNNDFRDSFEKNGIIFSGVSPDDSLVEIIELKDHPWFIGCQFHPELKSNPKKANPLFKDFIKNVLISKGIDV